MRSRVEIAAYRELRPLMRDGRIKLRTAIVGATMVAVFVGAGFSLLDTPSDTGLPQGAQEVDTRRYDVLEGLNATPGDGLAAMEAGNERARLIGTPGESLPQCGGDVVFKDPRAADFCD